MTPAPPEPSVRGGRSPVPWLPFAFICQEWFAVAIAMVRVAKGREELGSQFGDVMTCQGCGNHQGHLLFEDRVNRSDRPCSQRDSGSDSEHTLMEPLKTQRIRTGNRQVTWFSNRVPRTRGVWVSTWAPLQPQHLRFRPLHKLAFPPNTYSWAMKEKSLGC